jgi:hypothetical protein
MRRSQVMHSRWLRLRRNAAWLVLFAALTLVTLAVVCAAQPADDRQRITRG